MSVVNKAYFSGGCFWCTEAIYKRLKGVLDVKPGYCGGNIQNPTYKEVCSGKTGHAETVEITYDSKKIDFKLLLEIFFNTHDPTTLNRQGNDVGTHYRSIAFYKNDSEKNIIKNEIQRLLNNKIYKRIVTEVTKFEIFYIAEDYHQDYKINNPNNPYIWKVSVPRINDFKKKFPELLK